MKDNELLKEISDIMTLYDPSKPRIQVGEDVYVKLCSFRTRIIDRVIKKNLGCCLKINTRDKSKKNILPKILEDESSVLYTSEFNIIAQECCFGDHTALIFYDKDIKKLSIKELSQIISKIHGKASKEFEIIKSFRDEH